MMKTKPANAVSYAETISFLVSRCDIDDPEYAEECEDATLIEEIHGYEVIRELFCVKDKVFINDLRKELVRQLED